MTALAATAGILAALASPVAATETGGASWYRDTQTASGERYDPDALTCAHRSAPFGTRLLVTHRDRSVTVRGNDRGPYVRGRIVDLTPAAFRRLAPLRRGVVAVTVRRVARG